MEGRDVGATEGSKETVGRVVGRDVGEAEGAFEVVGNMVGPRVGGIKSVKNGSIQRSAPLKTWSNEAVWFSKASKNLL